MISSLKEGKLPYYKVILACGLCVLLTFIFSKKVHSSKSKIDTTPAIVCSEQMNIVRLKNNKLTQKLLFSDTPNENSKYSDLKVELLTKIKLEKANNRVTNVAIYLRELKNGSWMGIQQNDPFDPGSILKLPILLAYLKNQELNNSSFDRQLKLEAFDTKMPKQTIVTNTIEIGKTYTVRKLLSSMIIDSDNQANALLNHSIEPDLVYSVFSDLGLTVPAIQQTSMTMSAIDVSKFLRVLFNSSYTTQNLSEFALDLLTQSKFQAGMKKGLPDGVVLAHKFGERGYSESTYQEIHETGIIYLENNPVQLTIMTSGNNQEQQTQLIADITKSCYTWLTKETTLP